MKEKPKDISEIKGICDSIGDGISIQDTDFRIIYQNNAHKNLIGDHVGEYCYKAYEKRQSVCEGCPVNLSFQDGKTHRTERSATTKSGIMHIEISASPLKDSAGRIIAGIESVRDITERKQMEKQLVLAKEEWEQTFDAIPDIVAVIDNRYRIIRANKTMADKFGYTRKDLIGKLCYSVMHDSDAPPAYCPHQKAVADGKEHIIEMYEDNPNGHYLVSSTPVFDKNGVFQGVVEVARDITVRKNLELQLRTMSLTDELTGLYNRRGFFALAEQHLKQSKRDRTGSYLLVADLDHLKIINDNLGHSVGDRVLIDTSDIFKESFREADIIARIGGDEFVVLAKEIPGTSIETITKRLKENIDNYNNKKNKSYEISLSMGIARYAPEESGSLEELISRADRLMYEQKNERKQ